MFPFSNPIKSFSNKYSYTITKQKFLGSGFINLGVYRFKIQYFDKNDKLINTIYLAGKILDHKIQDYKNKIQYLKNKKLINYVIRTFNTQNTDIETENFDKNELENLLFLSDFSLQGFSVEPINEFEEDINQLNPILYKQLNSNQQEQMFNQILESLQNLIELELNIEEFDLWLILYNTNEVQVKLVDIDTLYHKSQNWEKLKLNQLQIIFFLNSCPKLTKKIFIQVLNSGKFSKLIKHYNLYNIEENLFRQK